jgi:gamma-glutamyltranspeptidase/glutathione hydrolase
MDGGGNAVDAAIAANAVLGVVAPDTCGLGGDLFALVHSPGLPAPTALNASGAAGSGAIAADLRDRGIDEVPLRSAWSVTVPGCVDGWEALLERYGTKPLSDLLAPAIDLATDGFEVSIELADALRRIHPLIGTQGSAPSLYPGGVAPDAGTRLTRPHLAETLRVLGDAGRESFYGGRVGEEITVATDGVITAADLERRSAHWVAPISVDVFGQRAWTIPPNSQGWLTLAACWLFEQMDPPRDPEDPGFHHAAIEAYRSVAWERDDLVSDAGTAPLPADQLANPDRLRPRLTHLSLDSTSAWPAPDPALGGTAYFCVRDGAGMGVSFIQSNFHGIGSGLSAGDTGVFLHNRGAGFNLTAGHPNEMSPGRRPLHTLSPSLWTKDDQLSLLLGTRGGQYQPQLLVQVATKLLWAGSTETQSQALPRWIVDGWGPGQEPRLQVESRMAPEVMDGLSQRGLDVQRADDWQSGWGPVSMITSDPSRAAGVADPRVSTASAIALDTDQ